MGSPGNYINWRESCRIAAIPLIQVRHKSIVVYPDLVGRVRRSTTKPEFAAKAYSGRVTCGVRKRLTKAINILLQSTKGSWKQNPVMGYLQYHRLSFITLKITNAENISAKEAYDSVFNHFLDYLTRTAGVRLFVWKAEMTRAGQIHYHITLPDMISHVDIRKKWNRLLRTAGYLSDYAKEHGHYDANSTDIHSVNDVENLSSYMVKAMTESIDNAEKIKKTRYGKQVTGIAGEMTKDIQNREGTEGKIWGCSEVLSAAHYVAFHMAQRHMEYIEHLEREGKIKRFSDDSGFWAVFHFTDCSPPDIMHPGERKYIDDHLIWQISKPSKAATLEEFAAWAGKQPILKY
jgi:hypothetical protein